MITPLRLWIPVLFFVIQCSMSSADVRNGEYLDKAKETVVKDFFEKRMKNRIKKVLGANWEILFESSEYVYYGYPIISFFREGTYLDEFFKVNKTQLKVEFPVYKEFDGISMKRICYNTLEEDNRLKENPKLILRGMLLSVDCRASLDNDTILIFADLKFKMDENRFKMEKYLIQFDKRNLKKKAITRLDK